MQQKVRNRVMNKCLSFCSKSCTNEIFKLKESDQNHSSWIWVYWAHCAIPIYSLSPIIDHFWIMERSEQRNELSIEDLVGQLGDTTEYNDLKEKVSQIAKSKVGNSLSPLFPDKSLCCTSQSSTRTTRKKSMIVMDEISLVGCI